MVYMIKGDYWLDLLVKNWSLNCSEKPIWIGEMKYMGYFNKWIAEPEGYGVALFRNGSLYQG